MNTFAITNSVGLVGFAVSAAYAGYKVSAIEAFMSANQSGLSEATAFAFRACGAAWAALVACSGAAALLAAVNLWRDIRIRKSQPSR